MADQKNLQMAKEQRAVVDGFNEKLNSRKGNAWDKPLPMAQRQEALTRDPGVKGPVWASKVTVPHVAQGSDVEEKVWTVVKDLGEGCEKLQRPVSATAPLFAEWTGARAGVSDPKASEPDVSEAEKYNGIVKDMKSDFTIFFVRGGAFAFGGKASARPIVAQLCHLSGARGFSFDYRLAPQHPWPTQIVDGLVAYLYLLSPPAGSFHDAIPASSIIFAGESAGATLTLSIIQLILHLHRKNITTIHYNGRDVPLELPAGFTSLSIPGEWDRALPSWSRNNKHDWGGGDPPWLLPNFPKDSIWPSNPPRANLYGDLSVVCHPLLAAAAARDWTGAPPMWFACGEECFEDSVKMIAQTAGRQGVPVKIEVYEYMPHVYAWVMSKLPQSKRTFESWAATCKAMVEDPESWKRSSSSHETDGGGVFVRLGDLQTDRLDVRNLLPYDREEGVRLMKTKRDEWIGWVFNGPDTGFLNEKNVKSSL